MKKMTVTLFRTPLPDVLRVSKDGVLYCADGRDVQEYLKGIWGEVSPDVPMVLVTRAALDANNNLAWMASHLVLAS